eukprot:jgi/Orpsp1_1/1186432/evm.model.d7180000050550.1
MSSILDMSLDERIQKSKRDNRNSYKRSNRKSNHYSSKGINDQWKHDKYDDSNSRNRRQIFSRVGNRNGGGNSNVLVSNLHWEVSEDDLKNLFEEVGEVSKVRIKYDKAGRSDGEAIISFNSKSDAQRAIDSLDGVELQGMEMKVEMDYSHSSRNNDNNDSKRNRGSILSRLGKGKGFKNRQNNNSRNNKFNNSRRRNQKETITKEMLDEEMDRYMSNEMDIEVNESNGEAAPTSRNLVSYIDEDVPVKGELNNNA